MALSEDKMREYMKRLLLSRMRILCTHGFFGLLLMHMRYAVDENVETAYTDGSSIVFGVDFLDSLSDSELDFVMMHEIMHVVLSHCTRVGDLDNEYFNIACDIVVNSNILLENGMKLSSITLDKYGESMHLTPKGEEGHKYTAEEVYKMLVVGVKMQDSGGKGVNSGGSQTGNDGASWDDHSEWGKMSVEERDKWAKRVRDAAEAMEIRDPSNSQGQLPLFAQRLLGELRRPRVDWRTILNDFVQEEIVDYSFFPPDRRFDGDFFLPDFNEKDEVVDDILFMVDTSGSMSDSMITDAFSEIRGAIDQFNGRLRGQLGFFDAQVTDPIPFESAEEFGIIRPVGGGGTDFGVVFDYIKRKPEKRPASIIILTDGYAPFPEKSASMDIPTLWLINNSKVTPPWGKVARIA